MDFPDIESRQLHLDRLLRRRREISVSFVFVELTTGLSSCKRVRASRIMTKENRVWHLAHAGRAFQIAEAAMWKLKLTHPEFNQMTAMAERLRLELQALQQ